MMLVGFFALHSGIFIFVHLVFLLALFSGDWFAKVHGPASFFSQLYLANGVWVALAFIFVANLVAFLLAVRQRPSPQGLDPEAKKSGIGPVIGTLYTRIVIMQIAILAGAVLAQSYGSLAPLLLVIGLKTLVDLAVGVFTVTLSSSRRPLVSFTQRKSIDTKSG
jgi:hypothetical protein